MSLASLEREIAAEAAELLQNSKFKKRQIMAWCTTEEALRADMPESEVCVHLPKMGVYIAIEPKHDKRERFTDCPSLDTQTQA